MGVYAAGHHCVDYVTIRRSQFDHFFDEITNFWLIKASVSVRMDYSKILSRHNFLTPIVYPQKGCLAACD